MNIELRVFDHKMGNRKVICRHLLKADLDGMDGFGPCEVGENFIDNVLFSCVLLYEC